MSPPADVDDMAAAAKEIVAVAQPLRKSETSIRHSSLPKDEPDKEQSEESPLSIGSGYDTTQTMDASRAPIHPGSQEDLNFGAVHATRMPEESKVQDIDSLGSAAGIIAAV